VCLRAPISGMWGDLVLCRLGRRTRADVEGQDPTLIFSNSWGLGEVVGDGLPFFEGGLEVFDESAVRFLRADLVMPLPPIPPIPRR